MNMDDAAAGLYGRWVANAARRGVADEQIRRIVDERGVTGESFGVLGAMAEFLDPDGKSFFLLPEVVEAEVAMRAVLMTYVFNAGTDYGAADDPANRYDRSPSPNDFEETPYGSAEVGRIAERQWRNRWSYGDDLDFLARRGGRFVTTPNGMLMGLGGSRFQRVFSQCGGTTWGDIFLLNIDRPTDPAAVLRAVVEGGSQPLTQHPEGATNNWLDLDRLLHHEEIHARQWADKGYLGFISSYVGDLVRHGRAGKDHRTEQEAGLHDGGYA